MHKILLFLPLVVLLHACDSGVLGKALQPVPSIYSINQEVFGQIIRIDNYVFSTTGNDEQSFSFVISDTLSGSHWHTLTGKSFVNASLAGFEAEEFAGSFRIQEKFDKPCHDQSLDSISSRGNTVTLTGQLKCEGAITTYSLSLEVVSSHTLKVLVDVNNEHVGKTGIIFSSREREQIFGLGEQFSHFNFKGKEVPILVSEQGLSRGKQPLTAILNLFAKGSGGYWYSSYAPIPHFISSDIRSLALDNSEYSIFDFRDPESIRINVYANQVDARLFFSDTPTGLIDAYSDFSGKMRALPEWVNKGAILGLQGGTEKVISVLEKLEQYDAKLSAVWIQDWQGQRVTPFGKRLWWNWELDSSHYKDFESMKARLASSDIKLMAYINPFLVDAEQKGNYRRNLYQEAQEEGYLLVDLEHQPVFISQGSFKAYMVDFSNPDARDWYKKVIQKEMLDLGFTGWMADFGEAMPFDSLPHSADSAYSLHNQYPVEWAKINRKAIDEHSEQSAREALFFMRSAYTKSPAYSTLFWLGDQATSWDEFDGIKTSVTALLTSGLSGFAFNHGDVGGYFSSKLPFTPHRSEELLLRWIELGAFQSVFRTHEGLLPDSNYQVYSNEKLMKHFSRFTAVYQAWSFYRKDLIKEAAEKGLPVMRHPFLHYPNEEIFWSNSNKQFLIGEALWYAPVLDEGQQSVEIHLPEGEWQHAFTGELYQSRGLEKAISIPSPIGTPAILYKKHSTVGRQFRENLKQQKLI